jgi:hypothetical protein
LDTWVIAGASASARFLVKNCYGESVGRVFEDNFSTTMEVDFENVCAVADQSSLHPSGEL